MKYTFILTELMIYPLSVVCPLLGVTQSGLHFWWRRREPSVREQERERLSAHIRKEFDVNRACYGAPRLYQAMCERHGYTGSFNRIQALMRLMGLRAKAGRKFKVTTDSAHQLPISRNLLGQDFRCDSHAGSTSHAKAPMESFWHSMKVEQTHGQHFATRAEATHSVFAYIEGWYNTTRMHSSLGYQSPTQFERACMASLRAATNNESTTIHSNSSHTARLNTKSGLNPQ